MRVDIPEGAPRQRFMRYVRPPGEAPGKGGTSPFPLRPATRPLRVGLDIRTLAPPTEGDLLDILRREDVDPFLLVQHEDPDPDEWMRALETTTFHRVGYSSINESTRTFDSVDVSVKTIENGSTRRMGRAGFFDVYTQLDGVDAGQRTGDDLDPEDRYRAAAFACSAANLGIDVMVTNAPTVGRADVADNDLVASVTPDDLFPIFGHYLRCSGNRNIRTTTGGLIGGGTWRSTHSAGSISELYAAGIDSGMTYFECLNIAASFQCDASLVGGLNSIRTRLARAARALDALLAVLTNPVGGGVAATDVTEAAAEAFDRELLYLCAAFDGYGRLYSFLINTRGKPARHTLTSRTFLSDTFLPLYPRVDTADVEAGQQFAHICAKLRHQIHESVLRAGRYLSRPYGSAKTIALDLTGLEYFDPDAISLTQAQVDRLGVWWADSTDPFGQPVYVADLATIATTLMVTALEYLDAFSRIILCNKPINAPHPHPVLGFAPDDGTPLPEPSETELYHRKLFGWHGGVSAAR